MLGEQIRKHRTEAGLTQEQLADRAGISQSYLSQLETSYVESLSLRTLKAIAAALGVQTSTLVSDEPTPTIPEATSEPPEVPAQGEGSGREVA